MSATGSQAPDLTATIAGQLASIRELLNALLVATRYDVLDIGVGRFEAQEIVLADSPGTGSKRLLIDRQGQGGAIIPIGALASPAPAAQVVSPNEARLGGSIVNRGAAPVFLFLCSAGDTQQPQGRPVLWLAAGGGAWDFRIGNALYAGPVCAAGDGGVTTLSIGEF